MNQLSLKLLRTVFESKNLQPITTGNQTDWPAFSMVGQLVRFTQDSDYIFNIISSLFPEDYSGNTIMQLRDKISRSLAKSVTSVTNDNGDDGDECADGLGDTKPPSQALLMLEMFTANGHRLFHDQFQRVFVDLMDGEKARTYPLRSTLAKRFLQRQFRQQFERPIGSQPFNQVLDILEGDALFGCDETKTYLRVAPYDDGIVINLADNQGNAVVVNHEGYYITNDPPVKFVRSPLMAPLPLPRAARRDILKRFQVLLGLNDQNFIRVMAFSINCFSPEGPYFCLMAEGEQGSGKSLLTEFIKTLVDASHAPKVRPPDNERDLMIQAKESTVLLFDNISTIRRDLSDAMCALATGGGFSIRKLFTDDEQTFFNECRPFILNGIKGIASKADLLQRSIFVQLPPMAKDKRRPERLIRAEFAELWPKLLDRLFHIVSHALKTGMQLSRQPR